MSAGNTPELTPNDDVTEVSGIGPSRGESLNDAGYQTVGDLDEATIEELSQVIPTNVASDAKSQIEAGLVRNAGPPPEVFENIPDIAQAKQEANKRPGSKVSVIRVGGRQVTKVLDKTEEQHLPGATVEVHKG